MGVHRQPDRRFGVLERVRAVAAAARVDGEPAFHAILQRYRNLTRACVSPQNFVAFNEFCIRACRDSPQAPVLCNHIYDVMGCAWNMPGDYNTGFDQCQGDSGEVRPVLHSSAVPFSAPEAKDRRCGDSTVTDASAYLHSPWVSTDPRHSSRASPALRLRTPLPGPPRAPRRRPSAMASPCPPPPAARRVGHAPAPRVR